MHAPILLTLRRFKPSQEAKTKWTTSTHLHHQPCLPFIYTVESCWWQCTSPPGIITACTCTLTGAPVASVRVEEVRIEAIRLIQFLQMLSNVVHLDTNNNNNKLASAYTGVDNFFLQECTTSESVAHLYTQRATVVQWLLIILLANGLINCLLPKASRHSWHGDQPEPPSPVPPQRQQKT